MDHNDVIPILADALGSAFPVGGDNRRDNENRREAWGAAVEAVIRALSSFGGGFDADAFRGACLRRVHDEAEDTADFFSVEPRIALDKARAAQVRDAKRQALACDLLMQVKHEILRRFERQGYNSLGVLDFFIWEIGEESDEAREQRVYSEACEAALCRARDALASLWVFADEAYTDPDSLRWTDKQAYDLLLAQKSEKLYEIFEAFLETLPAEKLLYLLTRQIEADTF